MSAKHTILYSQHGPGQNYHLLLLQLAVATIWVLTQPMARAQTRIPQSASAEQIPDVCKGKVSPLLPGKIYEGHLEEKGGQCWGVHLGRNQFLRAVVHQNGLDVLVTLLGGKDGPLVIDSPNYQNGPEPVSEVASHESNYVLVITTEDKAPKSQGYQIELQELRPARATDAGFVKGERAYLQGWLRLGEGNDLMSNGEMEAAVQKYLEAVKELDTSLAQLPSLEERGREIKGRIYQYKSFLHFNLGKWYLGRRNFMESLHHYEQYRSVARVLSDEAGEAGGLVFIAGVHEAAGRTDDARKKRSEAEQIAEHAETPKLRGGAWERMGGAYQNLRDYVRAEGTYEKAAAHYRTAGDSDSEVITLVRAGQSYFNVGLAEHASSYYEKALDVKGASAGIRANALYNLGIARSRLGENGRAIELLEAADRDTKDKDLPQKLYILNGLGIIYTNLGRPERALGYLERVQKSITELTRAAGNDLFPDVTAWNHLYLGFLRYREGDAVRGRQHTEAAFKIWEPLEEESGLADALVNLGSEAYSKGNYDLALTYLGRAEGFQSRAGDRHGLAYTLSNYGRINGARGDLEGARAKFRDALVLRAEVGDLQGEVETRFQAASVEDRFGHLAEAAEHLRLASEAIEHLRLRAGGEDLRASYFALAARVYDFRIDVLMRLEDKEPKQGHAARALQVSEAARARTLLEAIAAATVKSPSSSAKGALLEQERALRIRLDREVAHYQLLKLSGHPSAEMAPAEREVDARRAEWRDVWNKVFGTGDQPGQPAPEIISAEQIRGMLDEGTLFLEFTLGEERSYLWLVSPQTREIEYFYLPPGREITRLARVFINAIRKPPVTAAAQPAQRDLALENASSDLSKALFKDIAPRLGRKRLVIVPDGLLHYVPFAALADLEAGGRWSPIVLQHETVVLPSASALYAARRRAAEHGSAPLPMAIIANPVYVPDTGAPAATADSGRRGAEVPPAPLSFAEDEMSAIENSLREALGPNGRWRVWKGPEVTHDVATSTQLKDYRFIHYLAHGVYDDARPEASGLWLSFYDDRGRKREDRLLSLADVLSMKLAADAVVLSACETASGKELRGEGVISLTWGFMRAGSLRVVSSLWRVNDARSAVLMGQFYRRVLMRGMPAGRMLAATSLQEAQVFMYEKLLAHPHYWAAFELHGDWR